MQKVSLREARKAVGLRLHQVADILGISESQVSRIESGLRQATFEQAHKMAELYRVSIADISCEGNLSAPACAKSMRTLGERLKYRREELGLSQPEVAKRVSELVASRGKTYTQQAYQLLESGKSKSSTELPIIADVLGVDLVWLRDGEGQTHPGVAQQPARPSLIVSDSQSLLARVLERMESLGINDAEVSRRSGRRDIVKNIKAAARDGRPYSPQTGTMADLATALETTPGWLMGGSDYESLRAAVADEIYAAVEGVLLGAGLPEDHVRDILRLAQEACEEPLDDQIGPAAIQTRRAIGRALARKFFKPR